MKRFSEIIKEKKFIITAELFPPKGTDISKLLSNAGKIEKLVDAVNITDCQRAIMRASSLSICKMLIEKDIQPIYQITCRDRNRIALQSDLLGAGILGIENVLIISGDHPLSGDNPDAKPVYDLDTIGLIQTARQLMDGKDLSGKNLKGSPKFFIGAASNPNADPLNLQVIMIKKKILAGTEFFQTQPVFDIAVFEKFRKKTKGLSAKVLIGVMLLKSRETAILMQKIPGMNIPENIIQRITDANDPLKEGIRISQELIKGLKHSGADGIHIFAIGLEEYIPEILSGV